jgi:hypothetical protein
MKKGSVFIPDAFVLAGSDGLSVPFKNLLNRTGQLLLNNNSQTSIDMHDRYVDEPRHEYYSDTPPPSPSPKKCGG